MVTSCNAAALNSKSASRNREDSNVSDFTFIFANFFSRQMTLAEEQFMIGSNEARPEATAVTSLVDEANDSAQRLLNHYVKVQGLIISQVSTHDVASIHVVHLVM